MEMNAETFRQEVEKSSLPVLVEFYSDSCTYWHVLDPEMDQLKAAFTTSLKVFKINADKSEELTQKFALEKFPTLILFNKGEPVWKYSGLVMITQLLNVLENRVGITLPED